VQPHINVLPIAALAFDSQSSRALASAASRPAEIEAERCGMPQYEQLIAIDWSSLAGDAVAQTAAVREFEARFADAPSGRVRAYGDWAVATAAADALFALGVGLRQAPSGACAATALLCDLVQDLLDGRLPATVELCGDRLALAPVRALLRGRGVRVVLAPLVGRHAEQTAPLGETLAASAALLEEPSDHASVADASHASEPGHVASTAEPVACRGRRDFVTAAAADGGAGQRNAAADDAPTDAPGIVPDGRSDGGASAEVGSVSSEPAERVAAADATPPTVATPPLCATAIEQPTLRPITATTRPESLISAESDGGILTSPAGDGRVPVCGDSAPASAECSSVREPAAEAASPGRAEPAESNWAPRAQPAALPRTIPARPVQRFAATDSGPLLDTKVRRRLREIVKSVYVPGGTPFSGEPRQRLIDALCANTKGITERWWDFPDEVARGLLGLHICLYREVQQRGIDHVNSSRLEDAFERLRMFSATRYPGGVNGFGGADGPLGQTWLADARVRLAALEGWSRASGQTDRSTTAGAPASALSRAVAAVTDAAPVVAPPTVCSNAACARLAVDLLDARATRSGDTARCSVCHGSNSRRAILELAADLRAHGLHRLLVVGGTAAARQQLADRLAPHGVQVRGVDGEQLSPNDHEAAAEKAWAEVIVIWTQQLQHRVSGHYNDAGSDALLVWVTRGGVTQVCAAVRERLRTRRVAATA
jgi:hypothetical protein